MRRRAFFRNLRRRIRRFADFVPPTWRGLLVAVVAALALWRWAFGALDLVLFVIGIAGVVLLVLSSLAVVSAAVYLRRHLSSSTEEGRRLEAGYPIRTGFSVPSLEQWPLIKVRWEWTRPADVAVRIRHTGKVLTEEAVAARRSEVQRIRRRIVVEDAFGLSRVAWQREEPARIVVLPSTGELRKAMIVQSMAAAEGIPHPAGALEGDRMELRRYVPGDSVRHILWKTFARTRQLNVRTPERAIDFSRKTVAYLVAGDDDEPAAAAARVALEGGSLGEHWVFGADGTSEPANELEPALRAIARSGSYRRKTNGGSPEGDRGTALGAFLHRMSREGEAHCVVFVPARAGDWTRRTLDAARAFPGALSFVIGTDGVARDRPAPLWHRLLFTQEEPAGVPAHELQTVLAQLGASGRSTLVVDRSTGRSYGQAHQQAIGGR